MQSRNTLRLVARCTGRLTGPAFSFPPNIDSILAKIAAKLHPEEMRVPKLNALKYINQLSQR
jgi:hypothetical protein